MKSKKEIKINFIYYEEPFDIEKNFFIKLLKKKYKVVLSDNPDYVFFSVYNLRNNFVTQRNKEDLKIRSGRNGPMDKIKNGKLVQYILGQLKFYGLIGKGKMPRLEGNFKKIFYTYENVKPDMTGCDWAFSFYYDDEIKNPKHMRLPLYVTLVDEKDSLIKNKIDFDKIKEEKTRFCNFIYSSNVPFRNNFFRKLSRYRPVDSPGRCLNNMPPIGSFSDAIASRDSNNWVEQKQAFLKKYKFSIAFENSSSRGYTTEKLVQPMKAGSIPIYWGNPSVGRDFNKKSFLDLRDFKNMNELIKKIREIDQNEEVYRKMLGEPWLKNNRPNEWMNKQRILNRLVKIIESKNKNG